MRWGAVLRALCLVAAMTAGDVHAALAQQADDDPDDDDENALIVQKKPLRWAVLFEPAETKRWSLDFLTPVMPERLIYFTGFDVWRWGFGAYAGLQWAPNSVNKDGFILRVTGSESLDRFTTPTKRYETEIFRGAVMPGWRLKFGNLEVQVLAGPQVEADYQLTNRRLTGVRNKIGARFAADVWAEPTRALMLQYALSATTIDDGFTTRIAAGWRLFDRFWVGPEAAYARDFYSAQRRLGVHVTGLRTGHFEWSLAVGHIEDSGQREGIYGRLGILLRPPREPFFDN
jgi:hypothetical protein